ncbi:hypothetical protein [Qipengyuania nanhaisediminis]|uniref:hypothetical protein n=1 Tax=Qipengyuania nanhaisediminis TaxID=604088 RepID=UPI0038B2AC72
MALSMEFLTSLSFASDAERLALAGAGFWLFAGLCLVMERLRNARRSVERLERVGWMPWTTLFVASAIIGGGCLAVSLPVVLGSL